MRCAIRALVTSGSLYSDLPGLDLEVHIVRDVHKACSNDLLHGGAVLATPSPMQSGEAYLEPPVATVSLGLDRVS